MPIRFVAIDIDGTLLDSRGHVPARTIETLAAAIAAGTEIAIATGRRYDFARPILDQLPRPLTAIVSNGAVVRSSDGATPMRRPLPKHVAAGVLEATRPWRDGAALAFDRPREGQVIYERIDWDHPVRRMYAERSRDFIAEVAPLEDALVEDPLQVMFNGSVAEMRALVAHLAVHALAPHYSLAPTEYPARDFTLVDVLTAGCTKGSTMAAWTERQGYRRDEVMALGDNLNDLEMLEAAGLPVVMGNAVPELRDRGWAVTGTNDDAGVAQAIERWVFGT
jgi:Cof subfamily protein (haloacid dehalogenase superfamily)